MNPAPELSPILARLAQGESLTSELAESAFGVVMSGRASPVQIAALLMGLRVRGVVPAEVAGGVRALRSVMIPVATEAGAPLVDTCGTGGGGVTTFNVSTAAALVASAGGVRVAKHGNRSFTSKSGSADVLEALGVEINLSPEAMAGVLKETGIVFMFAPLLHPAMRHVGPVRRELGIPTIMNLLGPLTNPAGVRRQVVGVSEPGLVSLVIEALAALGHDHALVVHGEAGMDEISPFGPTQVAEWAEGTLRTFTLRPGDLGLEEADPADLSGGTPEENAERIQAILEGRDQGGARTITLLNAAAALRVGGVVDSLEAGVERAREALDSGRALRQLGALREASARYREVASSSEG
jgi:anthranilate phosphoribosyltransferase